MSWVWNTVLLKLFDLILFMNFP